MRFAVSRCAHNGMKKIPSVYNNSKQQIACWAPNGQTASKDVVVVTFGASNELQFAILTQFLLCMSVAHTKIALGQK